MSPPKMPPTIQGIALSGCGECDMPQVQAEVATTQRSRMPVLLTVPCTVMASPTPMAPWAWKAFSVRAGLEVRNGLGMVVSLFLYGDGMTQYCVTLSLLPTRDGFQLPGALNVGVFYGGRCHEAIWFGVVGHDWSCYRSFVCRIGRKDADE